MLPFAATADFNTLRSSHAAERVCLNDLPWKEWPYRAPADDVENFEGRIEKLLRLSLANTTAAANVKKASHRPANGASSSRTPPAPQRPKHCTVRSTRIYKELENVFPIAAVHTGKDGCASYGRVVVSDLQVPGMGTNCGPIAMNVNISIIPADPQVGHVN